MSLNPADKPGAADAILVAKKAIALYGQGANEQMSEIARDAMKVASQHPYATAALVGGVLVAAVPSIFTTPLLGAAGFGSAGVAKGSIAAAAHSTIGNVASGSAFAIAQSAGTGGAGATALNGGVQVATLSGFAAWGGRKWKSRL